MGWFFKIFISALLLFSHAQGGEFVEMQDALGRKISIQKRPERIISLAPSLTDMIFTFGADKRLIADTQFCTDPPAAKEKPKIGGLADPNLEMMKRLNPDLVICTTLTPIDVVQAIEKTGFKVVVFEHKGLEGVERDMESLGKILGAGKKVSVILADWQKRKKNLEQRVRGLARPKTLLLYGQDGLYSAGKDSFPDDLIRLAGGENVAAHAEGRWPQLSMEKIIEWNPDVILFVAYHGEAAEKQTMFNMEMLQKDSRWQTISAVKNHRIVSIDYIFLSIPGPRTMDAVEKIAQAIHPK